MPSSSATGSSRLGARESVDEVLEGVVVVDAATARGGAGSAATQAVSARHRVGLRASLPTTWTACPPTSTEPPSVPGGAPSCALKTDADGTCSFHAVWGTVLLDSQGRPVKLRLADARRQLLLSLPADIADLEAAVPAFVRDLLENYWFDKVWTDAVNFDLGERESERFRRHLPGAVQQDAKVYAERKKKADVELQSAERDFYRWAQRFFTAHNERDLVRPLANVLGYLQAEDDVDILRFSPAPNDSRCAAVEGPDSFEILHAISEGSDLTKYRALFQRDESRSNEEDRKRLFRRFFEGEDGSLRQAVLDSLDALWADTLRVEQKAVLIDAPETLRTFFRARDSVRSSRSWPRSFTNRAAWQALRGALQEPDYWLSPQELQILAACCGCILEDETPEESASQGMR